MQIIHLKKPSCDLPAPCHDTTGNSVTFSDFVNIWHRFRLRWLHSVFFIRLTCTVWGAKVVKLEIRRIDLHKNMGGRRISMVFWSNNLCYISNVLIHVILIKLFVSIDIGPSSSSSSCIHEWFLSSSSLSSSLGIPTLHDL